MDKDKDKHRVNHIHCY